MNKSILLKFVNPILGVLFLNQALTGFFHHSLSHKTFELLHEGGAIILVTFTIAHVYLNWGWIKSNFLKR
ncbi:MAG: hypothetical protein N3G21_09060 [Candidatus Hydrogenedentes bacterium]|nr:hypothetical protein [Candidatus Hydrogenedentota bacterium]